MTDQPKAFDPKAFLEFVKGKPGDEGYNYNDTHNCALCQFARDAFGWAEARAGGRYFYQHDHYFDTLRTVSDAIADTIVARPHRFGALAKRLEALDL